MTACKQNGSHAVSSPCPTHITITVHPWMAVAQFPTDHATMLLLFGKPQPRSEAHSNGRRLGKTTIELRRVLFFSISHNATMPQCHNATIVRSNQGSALLLVSIFRLLYLQGCGPSQSYWFCGSLVPRLLPCMERSLGTRVVLR